MSKQELAKHVNVEWSNVLNSGWSCKECNVSLNYSVKHHIDSHFFEEQNELAKRYIQEECLKRLHDDLRDSIYPEVKNIAGQLKEMSILMEQLSNIDPSNDIYYKGVPLYRVLDNWAEELVVD